MPSNSRYLSFFVFSLEAERLSFRGSGTVAGVV